jgi:hypothetical protein
VTQPPDQTGGTGLGAWYHNHVGEPFQRHHNAFVTALTAIGILAALGFLGTKEQPNVPSASASVTTASGPVEPSSASPSVVATKTQVIPFRPYTDRDTLAAQFKVGKKVAGLCDQPSRTTSSSEAMRCSGDDSGIYDPCWSNITMDQVACLETPWDEEVVILEPVDIEWDFWLQPSPDESFPFALEVEAGDGQRWRCDAVVAFAGEVAGLRRNFYCSPVDPAPNTPDEGSVFGEEDRSEPLWRVFFGLADSSELEEVIVLKAWI